MGVPDGAEDRRCASGLYSGNMSDGSERQTHALLRHSRWMRNLLQERQNAILPLQAALDVHRSWVKTSACCCQIGSSEDADPQAASCSEFRHKTPETEPRSTLCSPPPSKNGTCGGRLGGGWQRTACHTSHSAMVLANLSTRAAADPGHLQRRAGMAANPERFSVSFYQQLSREMEFERLRKTLCEC